MNKFMKYVLAVFALTIGLTSTSSLAAPSCPSVGSIQSVELNFVTEDSVFSIYGVSSNGKYWAVGVELDVINDDDARVKAGKEQDSISYRVNDYAREEYDDGMKFWLCEYHTSTGNTIYAGTK